MKNQIPQNEAYHSIFEKPHAKQKKNVHQDGFTFYIISVIEGYSNMIESPTFTFPGFITDA